jgi:hypothetical protein
MSRKTFARKSNLCKILSLITKNIIFWEVIPYTLIQVYTPSEVHIAFISMVSHPRKQHSARQI